MTTTVGNFPFGQPVNKVVQQDRSPKKVFVLGVYASAVHARWVGPDGRERVKALAVVSEPYIFWHGNEDEAKAIIDQIRVPEGLGQLEPAAKEFNGPSGQALDELFLKPLGFTRADAWLCDLVPHSCMNSQQKKAIERGHAKYGLPLSSVPEVPEVLADDARRQEILEELRESQARLLVLLGDQPVKWLLRYPWTRLTDFEPYGQRHQMKLDGWEGEVLPLVHPRQAGRLGTASEKWTLAHEEWLRAAKSIRR